MAYTILVATAKPFAAVAVTKMKEIVSSSENYKLELLESYSDNNELLKAIKNVDAVIIRSDKITKEVLAVAKNLKVVVRAGAGYDNIDLAAATANSVVAMNTPGQNSNAVAELAFFMMGYMARSKFNGKAGKELKEKTIGIHAYGNVGRNVARIAKGFGMTVYAFDPFVPKNVIENDGVKVFDTVEELYTNCNYISLHIPANDKTKKSIGYDLLSKMPANASLVNTARKEVIDEEGLLKLMEKRTDFSYIADIAPDAKAEFEEKFAERVLFTPKKMGAQSAEANINAGVASVNQIINYFENNDTTFQVNK